MDGLVSVIIPTYNGAKTIERALNSALNQTYKSIEVIIVNDQSTDNLYEVLRKVSDNRVSLYDLPKKGNGAIARNLGISKAKGEYIAFLDDDDEWSNLKISNQVDYLNRNKQYKTIITDFIYKVGDDLEYNDTSSTDYTKDILLQTVKTAAGSNILAYKSEVESIGGFDERLVGHQDLEFLIRLDQRNKVGHMKGFLVTINGSSRRGATNTDKFLRVKSIFLNKFKDVIEKYPKNVQRKIYARSWLQIARGYALEGKIELSKFNLQRSLEYSFLFSNKWKVIPIETYYLILFKYITNGFSSKNK